MPENKHFKKINIFNSYKILSFETVSHKLFGNVNIIPFSGIYGTQAI
jgi:hypothetical protein